jgi:hypothetical protein
VANSIPHVGWICMECKNSIMHVLEESGDGAGAPAHCLLLAASSQEAVRSPCANGADIRPTRMLHVMTGDVEYRIPSKNSSSCGDPPKLNRVMGPHFLVAPQGAFFDFTLRLDQPLAVTTTPYHLIAMVIQQPCIIEVVYRYFTPYLLGDLLIFCSGYPGLFSGLLIRIRWILCFAPPKTIVP